MRKVIAAINMTLDGFCDHTYGIADDELHQHYSDLLRSAGVILYGRITYQLMEFWPTVLKNPTDNEALNEFALIMDRTPKLVFSNTLKNVTWESAKVTNRNLEEVISELRQQPGKDIFVGSPSLIVQCTNLNLIDEYQLCIHPVIAGTGLQLFKSINEKSVLKLIKTKTLGSGAIVFYYVTERNSR